MTAVASLRELFTRNLRQSGIYIAFVLIIGLFAILTDGVLLSPGNLTNIVLQFSYILILAIGMVIIIIIIIAGHIDLSVGSLVALTGAVSAVVVIRNDQPWWLGVLAALGVAGYAVSAYRSRRARIAYLQSVEVMPLFVVRIAVTGAVVMAFAYQLSRSRGLPIVLLILGALILVYSVVTNRTVFGRHVYSIGGNLNAAQLSGVKVKRVNFWIFVNMGLLSAVAGVVYSSRSNGAQPAAGNMFELDAIAACFIGGASTTGGVGKVTGAMVGGLIMGVMSNGMQLMGIDQSVQQVIKGFVLLMAVAFDIFNKRRASTAR